MSATTMSLSASSARSKGRSNSVPCGPLREISTSEPAAGSVRRITAPVA